jgi:ribose transport system permease protein
MLQGGFGRIWGTVVGVIILELIGNILNLQSVISPYLNQAFQGVIIIVAVLLQRSRRAS